jgi:predicted nucleic acid-binding protein
MRDVAAVADSGPLIFLARIDLLNLLPELFSEVLIPPEVRDEVIVRGRNHPGAYAVSQAKWLTVQAPDPQLVKSLSILVDAGEAEAIALAQTTEDCTVLLDDLRARKVAQRLDIKQIGTVGLLLRAKKRGLLESIKPHLDALMGTGIYIRKELVEAVLKEAGEAE